ncbi:uncharacterized protein N7529_009793 [Penicillium soppii]|uniref:uncharacterized protein n=1 Tax=Penicillium soppii TaxID=69789 RepID=UPI00254721C6|nr:uncharacterized protein N7529_009793 [Penicillium soppii]KAJ5855849.1 hypothetical protein N7529_009793 [Penicillium soppii]
MAESDDLLIDNNEPKVKSTSLRTEEIKEKIGSTDSTPTNTKVNFPSSSTSAQGNPQPPMPASENQHTQPQKKQYFFKDLLALRPGVPHEQKINAKEYNVQKRQNMINRDEMCDTYWRRSPASHGRSNSYGTSSGTSNEIPYARTVSSVPIDRPVSKDTRLKPLTERSSYSSSTPAPGLGGPRSSNSPAGRSNIPTLGTAESTRGQRWERLQGNLPTSSLKETEKALLNFLQRVIDKEHRSKATAAMGILQDLPSPLDGNTPFTPTRGTNTLIGTPTSVPTSASVSAPAIEETSLLIAFEEAPAPLKRQENVSFLHPDLIDLSPASLRTKLRYDAVRRSNQSPDDQDDKPEICEKIADTEETQTRDYHTTMFHQQPSKFADYGMDGVSETTESARNGRNGDSNELTSGSITPNVSVNSHETAVQRCTPQIFKTAVKLPKERQALIDLFNSLGLSLDRVRDFPGPLTLEIQLGLMLILNTTASTQETEMTYKEVQNLFFSQHGLEAPRTSFFDRLTSSPADIDHLIGLKINDKPLFDQYATLRSIKYEFRCRASSNTIFIISVDQHRTVTLRYPRVHLGAVSMSFPAQVWDASAVLQGSTRFNRKADLELEKAVRELVESIWIDPESVTLQMLIRPPSTEVMTILGVYMERRTSHRWISEQSERIYLKVAETQVLNMTPSILDPEILVVNCAPHEEMLRHGKHWWQASITSAEIERILKQNLHVKPGTRNDSWNTVDLFGSDLTLINPSAKLSALGASVDHSGIGAMFRLAKIIVEKIDAIGFFNKGPAAYISRSPTDRGASTGAVSGEARSGTVSKSQDWNMAVGGWNPSAPSKPLKHRW